MPIFVKYADFLLMEPTIQGLQEQYSASEKRYFTVLENSGIDEIGKVSAEAFEDFVSYIFDNLESFKLILYCASGTKYTEFTDWMIEREIKDTDKTYKLLAKKGITVGRFPPKELHMLTHAYFSCIFETVLHNFRKKDALNSMKALADFFPSAGGRSSGERWGEIGMSRILIYSFTCLEI